MPAIKYGVFGTAACAVMGGVTMGISLLLRHHYLDLKTGHPALEVMSGAAIGLGAGIVLSISGYLLSQLCYKKQNKELTSDDDSDADPDEEARFHMRSMIEECYAKQPFYGTMTKVTIQGQGVTAIAVKQ